MSRALLEVRELSLSIGGRVLCERLDVAVQPGECWAIVGPNGAGKTTLLRTLAGLQRPARGEIRYGARPASTLSLRERARHRALLPQDTVDPFPATVLETILVGRHPYVDRFAWESVDDVERARDALRRFGLAGFESRDVRTLSGGERRRVALAALLVQDAPLALLDEPSSHLDLGQQTAALDVFVTLTREQGRALIMVLHELHLAARFCERVIAIGSGSARAGPAEELLTSQVLTALFGRPIAELEGSGLRTFVPL